MKKYKNYIIRAVSCIAAGAVLLSSSAVFASILGTETSHSTVEYAQGTYYNRATFQSDSVGQQTENYFEYTPNADVLPMISNGAQVYGRRTVLEANSALNEQGIFAAMGMNADFFSFATGVPMSNTIVDGKVLTCDTERLYGLGFNADGTAFVSPMQISVNLSSGGSSLFNIECINKYRQPYILYLYTDEFGDYTNAEGSGINVVFGSVSGGFGLGQPVTATVESITEDNGSVAIPDGKLLLSVDSAAPEEVRNRISMLSVGQTVTITASETTGDSRWLSAQYGTGCLGGTLLLGGELAYEDDIAAPRSAVGIKADGSIIFYTIDGRQQGYSYGVRKETLARRLLELGCVDAVNLDGGGSTQLAGTLPETTEMVMLNSPSESLRACANFIFLRKTNAPDGIPYKLLTYPNGEYALTGSTVGVWVAAIDKSYGRAQLTEPVSYSIESGNAEINQDGYAVLRGEGDIYVNTASGAASGSAVIHSVSSPDSVTLMNEADGSAVSSISLAAGQSIDLTADSTYGGAVLHDSDDAYTWSLSSDSLGSISSDGVFTAAYTNGSGRITVSAGGASAGVNVSVTTENASTPTPVPRPPETDFPEITCSSTTASFVAKIYGTHGEIDDSNITLTVDGRKVSFDFDAETNTLEYTFPEGYNDTAHRIAVSVTDSEGYSAYRTHTTGELSLLANPYADTGSHWARDVISYMSGRNVVSGYNENGRLEFRPDNNMTRAEFACMISNYLNINVYNYRGVELPYDDKESIPDWAYMQVQALYQLGIMSGQQNGGRLEFAPSGNIRRSEFSVAASRLLPSGLYSAPINASDAADVPSWAADGTSLLLTHGIMNGYTDGSLRSNNNVTRAEAVKIMFSIG